ncbi:MAG: EAL domain-containing protein [Pseudomonadales bacterium]|nr:EAL domain-containing protein [Pseudomonadales bacterium]
MGVRQKLILIVVGITAIIIVGIFGSYGYVDYQARRVSLVDTAGKLIAVVGTNSTGALAFNDPDTANEILEALGADSTTISAQIFTQTREPFAFFESSNPLHESLVKLVNSQSARLAVLPSQQVIEGTVGSNKVVQYHDRYFHVAQPIEASGRVVGYISIQVSTAQLLDSVYRQMEVVGLFFLAGLVFAYILAVRFQRVISEPIIRLANAMQDVSTRQNYSLRVKKNRDDELGDLIEGFNVMLGQIESRDQVVELAREEAEEGNRMKSQFLANMSHEIRTPMNGVLGMTELLLGTELNHRQLRYLKTVQNSGVALLNVINDILDFSKIEAHKLVLDCTEFVVRELVVDVANLFAESAATKGLEMLYEVGDDVPLSLIGDSGRLRQILVNLIGNAIKFTEIGEVLIQVTLIDAAILNENGSEEIESKARLRFEVHDSGIGIKPEAQKRIFEAFSQADDSTTRTFGGTGLGLSISTELVKMMNGEMSLKSELGEGAIFYFSAEFENLSGEESWATKAVSPFNGQRVLIVDDNKTCRELLGRQLVKWGLDTSLVSSGVEALTLIATNHSAGRPFNLVILDLFMPGMDGLELAEAINRDENYSETQMILLTTGDMKHALEAAPNLGIAQLVRKPVFAPEMLNCIKIALEMLTLERSAIPVQDKKQEASTLPQFKAKILLAEDNLVNQMVAQDTLELFGCEVELAENGEYAVRAVNEHDYDLVFMDIQMPVLDGCQATQKIREGESLGAARIPIIALTANAMDGDRERFLAAGMDDYLSKPFEQSELIKILEHWLAPADSGELPDIETKVSNSQTADGNAEVSYASLDENVLSDLRDLYGENFVAKFRKLTSMYFAVAGPLLVQLKKSIDESNTKGVREAAHSLKSSSGNIGSTILVALCKKLEIKGIDGDLSGAREDYDKLLSAYKSLAVDLNEDIKSNESDESLAQNTCINSQYDMPRILVADDDDTARFVARDMLLDCGFRVLEAVDGHDMLVQFESGQPDLILLDVEMPNMNGIVACEKLRSLPEGKSVPVIMLTGRDDVKSIETAFRAGATDFSVKPVNWKVLVHRINYVLRSSKLLKELKTSEARLLDAQKNARLGYWEWNPIDQYMYYSDEASRILGRNLGASRSLREFFRYLHPDDYVVARSQMIEITETKEPYEIELRIVIPDGEVRTVAVTGKAVPTESANGTRYTGTIMDITELKRSYDTIRHLAYHDILTNLPNRRSFDEYLQQSLDTARSSGTVLSLVYIDLDDFKRVNDSLGHEAGDYLLKEVAARLGEGVRINDAVFAGHSSDKSAAKVSRFGGDEFTLVLTDVSGAGDTEKIIQRLQNSLSRPYLISKPGNEDIHELYITTSIGVAIYPQDGKTASDLLKNADIAMYHAKRVGKNNFQFYSPEMNERTLERLNHETKLRTALEQEEFELHYQPQIGLSSNTIEGVEALLRWNNPELGSIPPDVFIPIAEETGLILSIGEWVFRTACEQNYAWQQAGLPPMTMAINLSSLQFRQANIVETLEKIMAETKVDPHTIELELTESVIMSHADANIRVLSEFKSLGVKLAIDDFGTGYSSLIYLKSFPLDILKVDRMFVKDLATDKNDQKIVGAIVTMAHGLGLEVVAEGVEDEEQLQILQQMNCDQVQGYLYARPMPAREASEFMLQHATAARAGALSSNKPLSY